MSFQNTSEDIRLRFENSSTHLLAKAQKRDGSWNNTRIRLDDCIGNENGVFEWGCEDFTKTSQDVRLNFDGDKPILRADLQTRDGRWQASEIDLGVNIENQDGELVYLA